MIDYMTAKNAVAQMRVESLLESFYFEAINRLHNSMPDVGARRWDVDDFYDYRDNAQSAFNSIADAMLKQEIASAIKAIPASIDLARIIEAASGVARQRVADLKQQEADRKARAEEQRVASLRERAEAMDVTSILAACREADIALCAITKSDGTVVSAKPALALTESLRMAIQAHRDELIAFLEVRAASADQAMEL